MAQHKGWRIRPDANRVRAEVWVPERRGYVSKTFATGNEAKTWAMSEAGKVASGGTGPVSAASQRVSVESLATPYLKSLEAKGKAPSHLSNVRRTLQALDVRLADLADPKAGLAIEEWLDGHSAAAGTRNRMLVEMRAMMRWAIKRDLLAKDPTRAIERFTVAEFMKPLFTLEEVRRLIFHEHDYRLRFIVMLYQGLRSDEAAALTWANIERAEWVAVVKKHAGHRLKRNKERLVPLQEELMALLPPEGRPEDPVCPVRDTSGSRSFRAFLQSAGVPIAGRSPHSCRHTYASLMVATGIPDLSLRNCMGHGDTKTTAVYTKQATRFVQAVEQWGRGKLRICEGMTSQIKKNPRALARGF